jgi:hypothetical protein
LVPVRADGATRGYHEHAMKQTKKAEKANRLERKRLARVDRELARQNRPKPVQDGEPNPAPSES